MTAGCYWQCSLAPIYRARWVKVHWQPLLTMAGSTCEPKFHQFGSRLDLAIGLYLQLITSYLRQNFSSMPRQRLCHSRGHHLSRACWTSILTHHWLSLLDQMLTCHWLHPLRPAWEALLPSRAVSRYRCSRTHPTYLLSSFKLLISKRLKLFPGSMSSERCRFRNLK